jgi:hypothetical protein
MASVSCCYFLLLVWAFQRAAVGGAGNGLPMAAALLRAMHSTVTQDANEGYGDGGSGNIRFVQIAIRFVQGRLKRGNYRVVRGNDVLAPGIL